MGYCPVWQVSHAEDVPHYSTYRLCNLPDANTLQHYCLERIAVRDLLPEGQELINICKSLFNDDYLDTILVSHPHLDGY